MKKVTKTADKPSRQAASPPPKTVSRKGALKAILSGIPDKIRGSFGRLKSLSFKEVWQGIKSTKRRTWLIVAGVALLIVLCVILPLANARQQSQLMSQLQTAVAARGDLTATIGATGTVRASQTASLIWQTGGTVEKVHVESGDRVRAGDVLAVLTQESLPQSVILAQAELVTARRNLDDLLHSNVQSAQAQLNLVNAQKNYDNAKATLNMLLARNRGATTDDLRHAQAQHTIAEENLKRAEQYHNHLSRTRPEDDPQRAQAYVALYNARQALRRTQSSLNYFLLQPSAFNIEENQAKLAVAEAALEDAQRAWERLQDGPDPDDVAAARARVAAIQATLNMAQLSAPFAGTVTEAHPLAGDQVTAGSPAFRVDNLARLLVDVQVSEVDINSVKVGQPVVVSLDAVFDEEFQGVVTEVARVGNASQGAVNFMVTVELSDADAQVKPGMTAAVTILVNQQEDVLLVPNRAVRLVNSQRVVYVLRNGAMEQVAITLGATSDLTSQVLAGDLAEGDVIILNPPAELMQPGGNGRSPFGGN